MTEFENGEDMCMGDLQLERKTHEKLISGNSFMPVPKPINDRQNV